MATRFFSILLVLIFIIGCSDSQTPSVDSQSKSKAINEYNTFINDMKSDKIRFIYETKKEGLTVTYFIDKQTWSMMPYEKKKDTVKTFSRLQKAALDTEILKFKDYYSGKLYAEYGVLGEKIYE